MKKLFLLLAIAVAMLFAQCGGEANDEPATAEEETVNLGNTVEIDLSKHGFPLSIEVPAPDEETPEATVAVLDWGALEIKVNKYFQIQIADGEGNIAAKKQNNADMYDNIYTIQYLLEEETALLYKTEIPGSGIEPEFHFFAVIKAGGRTFEVEDIKGVDSYSEESARRMLDFAKAIKVRTQS